MSDYDQDILRQAERDGVRTMIGHHIRTPEYAPGSGIIRVRWECSRCMDQGCDYCNPPRIPDDELFATLAEWREQPQ